MILVEDRALCTTSRHKVNILTMIKHRESALTALTTKGPRLRKSTAPVIDFFFPVSAYTRSVVNAGDEALSSLGHNRRHTVAYQRDRAGLTPP